MDELIFWDKDVYGSLTDEEKARISEIQNSIDFNDPNAVLHFGSSIQGKISEFADSILSEVKVKDTDYIGKILTDLILKVRELHPGATGRAFSKIPFIKPLVHGTKKFMAEYRDVSIQVMSIVEELEKAKVQLLRDSETLDRLYRKNLEYFYELNIYIMAGKIKLQKLREEIIPSMESAAEKSNYPADIQKYRDIVELAGRIEKKIHDLMLSRTVSLQTSPQIRLVQNNNQELAQKIQSSILNTVPLWKNQMLIAISLLRQRNMLEIQKEVSETTKALLEKNSEILKESSAGITRESERGIVDIGTLKKVNADLISTIEETIKIQQEGKLRRRQAEEEIGIIEKELKQGLLKIKELKELKYKGVI